AGELLDLLAAGQPLGQLAHLHLVHAVVHGPGDEFLVRQRFLVARQGRAHTADDQRRHAPDKRFHCALTREGNLLPAPRRKSASFSATCVPPSRRPAGVSLSAPSAPALPPRRGSAAHPCGCATALRPAGGPTACRSTPALPAPATRATLRP